MSTPATAAPAEGREAPAPRRTGTAAIPTWGIGLALVLLHLLVAFQVRPHPRWNDGLFVLNDAATFPDAERALDHHALRIGNLFPVRAFLEVFGYGQWAYYAWPFVGAILLVVAVFFLGTVLFGRWTAAVATVALIFHPVLVDTVIRTGSERMTSWQLLPDIPSTAFFTLGLALLIAGASRGGTPGGTAPAGVVRTRVQQASAGGSAWWFVGAGLCFGWAYLVRELTVFVFPVIVVVLLAWRVGLRRWVQVGAAMFACLVLELVVNAWAHGDALVRLKVGSEHGSPIAELTRLDALLRFPRAVVGYPQTLLVLASFVLMVLGALAIRRRGHVLMLVWFVSMWLPLTLVSGLIDPGFIRINASLMRYWVPVLPSLVLGATAALAWALGLVRAHLPERAGPAGLVGTAVVAVLGLAVTVVPLLDDVVRNPRDEAWNAVRAYLAENDADIDTIVTDDRDALILAIYLREPVGGGSAARAEVEKVPHGLRAPPVGTGEPGTYLLWTPGLSRKKPQEFDGWRLLVRQRELRLYGPVGA